MIWSTSIKLWVNHLPKQIHFSMVLAGCVGLFVLTYSNISLSQELRPSTYKAIQRSNELLADNRIEDALNVLNKQLKNISKVPLDKAVVHQQLGISYAQADNLTHAAKHFENALAPSVLPDSMAQRLRYNLAQILAGEGHYKKSINYLNQWIALRNEDHELKKNPVPARLWMLLAHNHFSLKDYRKTIKPANNAINSVDKPKESWLLLLFQAHYELRQYKLAANSLERVIKINPNKKQYWINLYSINIEAKDEDRALAALRSAYFNGLYTEATDYRRLADFLAYLNVPYEAAQIYLEGIEKGIIDKDQKSLKKLANFWALSREHKTAIVSYTKALEQKYSPELQLKIANLQHQIDDHQGVLNTLKSIEPEMSQKNMGKAHYLKGVALFNLGQVEESLNSMEKAYQFSSSKKMAHPWVNFLKEEKNRLKEEQSPS